MITPDLEQAASAHGLTLHDHAALREPGDPLDDRVTATGGNGIVVGTLAPTSDGLWVAVPGNFPAMLGDAAEVTKFLAGFGSEQTFGVVVTFDRAQVTVPESNHEVVLDALTQVVSRLYGGVGGVVRKISVGYHARSF